MEQYLDRSSSNNKRTSLICAASTCVSSAVILCWRGINTLFAYSALCRKNSKCDCRYYSATILQMAGVEDTSTAIWLASLTAFINFAFTFVGLFLVERIGRRPLTLGSLTGQTCSCVNLSNLFDVYIFDVMQMCLLFCCHDSFCTFYYLYSFVQFIIWERKLFAHPKHFKVRLQYFS